MPQQTANKKVVSSKGGRKISTPVGLLFIAVAALLLALLGAYGYGRYKAQDLQAKADSWTKFDIKTPYWNGKTYDLTTLTIMACKVYNPWGPDGRLIDDGSKKPGKVKFLIKKDKSAPIKEVSPHLYTKVTPKRSENPLSLTKIWERQSSAGISPSRSWWNGELGAATLDSNELPLLGTQISFAVLSSSMHSGGMMPPHHDEYANQMAYREISPTSLGGFTTKFLKTTKEYQKAEKHWLNTFTYSTARISNCPGTN